MYFFLNSRPTVLAETPNNSATSPCVFPESINSFMCWICPGDKAFGLPTCRPRFLAALIPALVRSRVSACPYHIDFSNLFYSYAVTGCQRQ